MDQLNNLIKIFRRGPCYIFNRCVAKSGVYSLRFGPKYLYHSIMFKIFKKENDYNFINLIKIDYFKKLPEAKYPRELRRWYRLSTGERLNLDNPRTFNEKIQWLKLYDTTPLKTRLADKYLMRGWVSNRIGSEHLIPLLGVWDHFDDINFNELPNQFVLKCNHGCGFNIIVTDKNTFNKSDAKQKIDYWMSVNFAFQCGFELQYRDIPHKIIAEKYMPSLDGSLIDYRIYCFNGQPQQIWADIFSGTPNHRREIFDLSWHKLPLSCLWPPADGLLDNKPKTLDEMYQLATQLSRDFAFVRVDFYEISNKVYLGELTFTPMSGTGHITPSIYNLKLGSMLDLPSPRHLFSNKEE